MSFSFLPVAVLSLPVFLGATMFGVAPAKPAARFEGKDTLLLPEGYREWVFVGSSQGLRYDEGKKVFQRSGGRTAPWYATHWSGKQRQAHVMSNRRDSRAYLFQ